MFLPNLIWCSIMIMSSFFLLCDFVPVFFSNRSYLLPLVQTYVNYEVLYEMFIIGTNDLTWNDWLQQKTIFSIISDAAIISASLWSPEVYMSLISTSSYLYQHLYIFSSYHYLHRFI